MGKRVMYLILALAAFSPASTITAASTSHKLARCDGQHRRTANPYGSILPTVDPLTGAPAPASGIDVFPEKPSVAPSAGQKPAPKPNRPDGKPEVQVPPISRANSHPAYRSC